MADILDPLIGQLFDPFIGPVNQTSKLKAYCKVIVGGTDVTDKLDPHLISVRVLDGVAGDYNCEIEVDDRDARLPIPPIGADVEVELGWENQASENVFTGTINDVEYGFGRKQGGRRMWIHGFGENLLSEGKSPMQNNWGEGAPPGQQEGSKVGLGEVLNDAAGQAGHSIKISPSLSGIQRDYWAQTNESFLHMGQRLADEFGSFFRVIGGNQAQIIHPNDFSGTVICDWDGALIGLRVRPMAARPAWGQSNQQFYDLAAGQWKRLGQMMGLPSPWGDGKATYALPAPAPNSTVGGQQNQGASDGAGANQGPGRIVINGDPSAHFGMYAQVIGMRPGVDGSYMIMTAEHLYSRQGYVTWLDVVTNPGASGGDNVGSGMGQDT